MRLSTLRPAWEAEPGRERMGVSLDCPRHPGFCKRAEAWFDNPLDGGPPRAGVPHLVVAIIHEDEPLEHLTLIPAGGYPPDHQVELGHWRGWVADGVLTESLIGGVAW